MQPQYTPRRGPKPKPLAERFWAKVNKRSGRFWNGTECWEWIGYRLEGYGRFRVDRRLVLAHRLAYQLAHGPLSDDICVLHRCDYPPCCRPEHLFAGTHVDNMRDMANKGRASLARLSSADVAVIRHLAHIGLPQPQIAALYGVTPSNVSAIVRRKSWRGVT